MKKQQQIIEDEFEAIVCQIVRENGEAMLREIFSLRAKESLDIPRRCGILQLRQQSI